VNVGNRVDDGCLDTASQEGGTAGPL